MTEWVHNGTSGIFRNIWRRTYFHYHFRAWNNSHRTLYSAPVVAFRCSLRRSIILLHYIIYTWAIFRLVGIQ